MNLKFRLYILFTFLAGGQTVAYSFPHDSVSVNISMKKTDITKKEDLLFKLTIRSKYRRGILIPKYLSIGLWPDTTGEGFVCIQIQRKDHGRFQNVNIAGIPDNIPVNKLDTLGKNEEKDANVYIGFFAPNKGQYRVRVLCFTSRANVGIHDILSNWAYFQCHADTRHSPKS
jgi:hypothetical protein